MATKKKSPAADGVWIPEKPESTIVGPLYAVHPDHSEGGKINSTLDVHKARHFGSAGACEVWINGNGGPSKWVACEHLFDDGAAEAPPPAPTPAPAPASTAPSPPEKKPTEPLVRLEDWAALSARGSLSSRYAGFVAHAKGLGKKRATSAEWADLFNTFLKAPVR